MSPFSRMGVRTGLVAAVIGIGALSIGSPARADHGRTRYSHGPRVGVVVGLPPFVLVAGQPQPYAPLPYDEPPPWAYERGYAHGYRDGYDERAWQEWRHRHRHHRHHRHHHHDCDD